MYRVETNLEQAGPARLEPAGPSTHRVRRQARQQEARVPESKRVSLNPDVEERAAPVQYHAPLQRQSRPRQLDRRQGTDDRVSGNPQVPSRLSHVEARIGAHKADPSDLDPHARRPGTGEAYERQPRIQVLELVESQVPLGPRAPARLPQPERDSRVLEVDVPERNEGGRARPAAAAEAENVGQVEVTPGMLDQVKHGVLHSDREQHEPMRNEVEWVIGRVHDRQRRD